MNPFLSVLIVVFFGALFISSILNEPVPSDPSAWWYEVIWSVFAIALGAFGSIYTKRFNDRNKKWFLKMYGKTKFPLFRLQAEETAKPYMYPFMRAMGVLFVVIGVTMLIRNLL